MSYPVTAKELGKEFEAVNGCEVPEHQKVFWEGFATLLNDAYNDGIAAGLKEAQEASCKA